MKSFKIFAASIFLFAQSATSCGYMQSLKVFSPNTCKKCVVTDEWGSEVWSEEDCGGGKYNMDQRCKATAYDYGGTCDCETYREEDQ